MEFSINRVYTSVNADMLKIGSKVILADTMKELREKVSDAESCSSVLIAIRDESFCSRFITVDGTCFHCLAYLMDEPEEKRKLKWTDLKLGDIIRKDTETALVESIDTDDTPDDEGDVLHICAGGGWIPEKELGEWEKVEIA